MTKTLRAPLASILLAFGCLGSWAGDTNDLSDTNNLARRRAEIHKLEAGLHFQTGVIDLKDGLATVTLPDDFRYLGPDDTKVVLEQMWGNPPGAKPLGMIVPAKSRLVGSNSWAIVITYAQDGYVKDADADKINYDDLLHKMQKATTEASAKRVKEGYPSIEFVGWAEPPRYDKAAHKLYWARDLRFGDETHDTLNYNIRVLGRRGVLVLNAVAPMSALSAIQDQTPAIVKMVDFNSGNRYADFNGSTDKVAAYGLAALVAGGVAAKLGGFKLLLAGILAAKKFVVLGLAAVATAFKKVFKRKSPDTPPTVP